MFGDTYMMNILQVHQCYRQSGGEEQVLMREAALLKANNVNVTSWRVTPEMSSPLAKLETLMRLFHNRAACETLQVLQQSQHVDLLHLHNGFPYFSPSFLQRAAQLKLPVVMTLHNFRLLVPSGVLTQPLLGPIGTTTLIRHSWAGKYQQSVTATSLASLFIKLAQWRGWVDNIAAFICPSNFVRKQFITAGWPAEKLHVIPHFCWPLAEQPTPIGGYALVVGRDDPIKGIDWLVSQWHDMPLPLKVVGVAPRSNAAASVEFCGQQEGEHLKQLYQNAALVIVPSQVCETFCNVVMEAFSAGKPCVVADCGALVEWVIPGVNGEHFCASDVSELRQKLWALLATPKRLEEMGQHAFASWQRLFSPERHQQQLLALYDEVLKDRC